MKAWWAERAPREQMILGGGGVAAVIILVWLLAWEPLASDAAALKRSIAQQEEDLAWMREAAGEVIALRSQGGSSVAGLQGRSLLAVVDQSARQAGLGGALKRVEPEGSDKVRVRFEGVAFDSLILWLSQINNQFGVSAAQVSVEPDAEAGRVTARLTLIAAVL